MIVVQMEEHWMGGQCPVAEWLPDVSDSQLPDVLQSQAGLQSVDDLLFGDESVMFAGSDSLNDGSPLNYLATAIRTIMWCRDGTQTPSNQCPVCGNALFIFEDKKVEAEIASLFGICDDVQEISDADGR